MCNECKALFNLLTIGTRIVELDRLTDVTQRMADRVQIPAPANHKGTCAPLDNPISWATVLTLGTLGRHKRALESVTPITSVTRRHGSTRVDLSSPRKWLFSCRDTAARREDFVLTVLCRTRLETVRRWKPHQQKHTRFCTTAASLYPVKGQELTAVPNRDVAYSDVGSTGLTGG